MLRSAGLTLALALPAFAQTTPSQVTRILERPLQAPGVVAHQLRQYLDRKVLPPPSASSAAQWTAEAARLRRDILDTVVTRGWPRPWFDAAPQFEDLGDVPAGPGYRIRKLRYEVVPGLQSTALLYLPAQIDGRRPAILNVNGHVGAPGKAVEYKQKRCVNFARHGIIALNLEWLGFGELTHPHSVHWFGAHLDLAGSNALGLFYLAMRRGLDYLDRHPGVDRTRLGVTGLSGGGWQTVILSALDERVAVSVPVAGYSSLRSRIERPADTGDIEQNATDLLAGRDYPHFTAMRAPRPTLLIYNAQDDCCFRAPLVKPHIFDAVHPVFALYGRPGHLAWHENLDPGTHNYYAENRLQAYRFFSRHFGLPEITAEPGVDAEVKTYGELVVGLPESNLTILGLARRLAAAGSSQDGTRERLAEIVRYRPVEAGLWTLDNSKNQGLETISARVDFSNGLAASAVFLHSLTAAQPQVAAILLDDNGRKTLGAVASDRVNRGQFVVAADLLFTGDSVPHPGAASFAQLLATTGDRALGIEAAQLIALAELARQRSGAPAVELQTRGMRSQTTALVAAALRPALFRSITIDDGIPSLRHLLDAPVEYQAAPDLFCLGLLQGFDLDRLAQLAQPARVVRVVR